MRVTFVLPHAGLAGGIRVAAIYAKRLQDRGHKVCVVSTPLAMGRRDRLRSVLQRAGMVQKPPPAQSYFDGLGVEHRVLESPRPVRDADVPDADVVIATWWETAEWVAMLSPAKGAKAYFIQHYEVFPEQPRERVEATWRLPLKKITISQWLVDIARERYGDEDVHLVENGVDSELFHAPPRGKQMRPTLGFLYSASQAKGCDVSLRAIQRIRPRFPDLKVMSFGAELPGESLPLPPDVEFTHQPPQQTLRGIYGRLDVWLCGSRAEGFHLPPLEAMACRTPVVATRVGGTVETVRCGVNGYLVEQEDDAGLADGLAKVLSASDQEWRRMSEAALETARAFNWEVATDKFERALAAICCEAGREQGVAGAVLS